MLTEVVMYSSRILDSRIMVELKTYQPSQRRLIHDDKSIYNDTYMQFSILSVLQLHNIIQSRGLVA
jgi:hypothetical protein